MSVVLWLALLLNAATFQSPEITARFNHAAELQRSGNLAAAEAEYRAVLTAAPAYAEAHANLGAVLMRLDRYDQAIAAYREALRLAPELHPVRLNLGIAHYRRQEFEKAVAEFKGFLGASPGHVQAMQLLGLSLVELGRDREAVGILDQALEASPADPAVLYGFGLALLRLQRPAVAGIVERLAASPDGQAVSHLLRGQVLLFGSEPERALAEFERAAGLKADLPRLQYSLGLAAFRLGKSRQALDAFEAERQTFRRRYCDRVRHRRRAARVARTAPALLYTDRASLCRTPAGRST